MSLPTPDAGESLYVALVSGVFALIYRFVDRKWGQEKRKDAWTQQAKELRNELRRNYEGQINYFKQELGKEQTAHDADVRARDHEIARLNRLLTSQRSDHDDQ